SLLELSSAVAPARDLAAALSAIAPHLRRVVAHEAASVYWREDAGRRRGLYAISPNVIGWTDELASMIRPDMEPVATWLAERRAIDIDVRAFDWTGREAIRRNLDTN